ncbi:DUF5776 domain-containing protein [Lactiplantibacillus plantarum]
MLKFVSRVLIISLLETGALYGKKQAITVHAEEVTQASNNEQNDYYKVAPKKVILEKDGYVYSNPNLDDASKKAEVYKGTVLNVYSIAYSNTDIPCLKVDGGYISAAKNFSAESSEPPKTNIVTDASSTGSNDVINSAKEKKSASSIEDDEQASASLPTRESDEKSESTNAGAYNQRKTEVSKTNQSQTVTVASAVDLSKYYTTNSGEIVALTDIKLYSEVGLKNVIKTISAGSLLKTQGVEYASGYPRFKVSGGYITANRSFVVQPTSNIANYYTTNTGQIASLTDIHVYSDVALTKLVRTVSAGTLLKVQGIEYISGYPRYKLADGYITANKFFVVQPVSSINNYYTSNPGEISASKVTHLYSDIDLTNIVKKVPAGTVYKVEKIQYSTSGYPRFKVAGGFISANKSIVAVYKESSNTEKANKVVALAKTKIGDPYTQSASGRLGPNSFDCSGFVYYVYKTALGIVLPGTTTTTEESAGKEVSLNTLKPGDLLFYGTRGNTYHVGIYEGNGIMVHAATPEEGVKETAIKYYEPSFARRILN